MENFWRDLLYAVITAAVPVLTTFVASYLSKLFEKIEIQTEQSIVHDTISDVLDIITKTVMCTSQTYVDALKKEGKFDEESQKIAFQTTKTTILSLLTEESKDLISTLYTDLDEWLDVQIESAVKSLKNN